MFHSLTMQSTDGMDIPSICPDSLVHMIKFGVVLWSPSRFKCPWPALDDNLLGTLQTLQLVGAWNNPGFHISLNKLLSGSGRLQVDWQHVGRCWLLELVNKETAQKNVWSPSIRETAQILCEGVWSTSRGGILEPAIIVCYWYGIVSQQLLWNFNVCCGIVSAFQDGASQSRNFRLFSSLLIISSRSVFKSSHFASTLIQQYNFSIVNYLVEDLLSHHNAATIC